MASATKPACRNCGADIITSYTDRVGVQSMLVWICLNCGKKSDPPVCQNCGDLIVGYKNLKDSSLLWVHVHPDPEVDAPYINCRKEKVDENHS